ncbi:MAG: glycosyltransferase, partial [Thermodesulfovibrionales bacterium]
DVLVTNKPNETFENTKSTERYRWFDWDREKLLFHGCFIGPQPMWRRIVHEDWGYFDESFIVSGDAEFWLRISQGCKFYHISEPFGLYLKSDSSIEHTNKNRRDFENIRIVTLYREAALKGEIIRKGSIKSLMNFDEDLLSVIAAYRDDQHLQPLIEMIRSLTDGKIEIISIKADHKVGFASLLNQAIAKVNGRNIAVVTDNVVLTDNTLSHLVSYLNDDVSITSPVTNVRLSLNPIPYKDFKGLREFAALYRQRNIHRQIESRAITFDCFVLRADLFFIVGIFDERFKHLSDCINDIAIRAVISGCKITISGDVYVHISDTGLYRRSDKMLFESKWSDIPIEGELGKRILVTNTIDESERSLRMGNLDNSVRLIMQSLRVFPEDTTLLYQFVKILSLSGMHDEIVKISKSLPKLNCEIGFYVCLALIHTGRFDDALDMMKRVGLDTHRLNYLTAIIHMKKGELSIAKSLIERVIQHLPSWGEPYRDLGLMQYSEGDREIGLLNIEKAFILNPCIPRITDTYHLLVSANKLYTRAEPLFREALRLNRDCNKLANFLIDILLKKEDYESALYQICEYFVDFGFNDDYINNALTIRDILDRKPKRDKQCLLSVCMIVKDEESNICRCLLSVLPIADEIIVVDTGSTDRTVNLAKVYGAKVFHYDWDDDYSNARNISIRHASGRWILILDADELISSQDYDIIHDLMTQDTVAYQVVTRNYTNQTSILNFIENDGSYREEKGLGWIPTIKVRLFPNHNGIRFKGNVHEMVDESIKEMGIEIKTAPFFIHHYGKLDVIKDRTKGERYYQLGLEKIRQNPNDTKAIKELAIVSGALGKIDEAIDLWKRLIEMGTMKDIDCYIHLANLSILKGEFKDALMFANRALDINKEDITTKKILHFLRNKGVESE